jgi:hypothetical protein
MVILEKEKKYTDKINAIKTEKQIIDKCKSEVNNNHLKTKELKMTAIFKLNGKSVLDKTEKLKTKQLALKFASDVNLEDIFRDDPKEAKPKDPYE